MSKPAINIYCPVCGRVQPLSSWAKLAMFGPRPFGIIQKSLGRARGFKTVGHVHIDDAMGVFELIKERMFGVLNFWFEKGLVQKEEVERAFGLLFRVVRWGYVRDKLPTLFPSGWRNMITREREEVHEF